MTHSASAAIERFQFDDFLFAPIGQEQNGMVLSVVSALARLDIDPWSEAVSLAQMSREVAIERMRLLIAAALPEEAFPRSDTEAIASRLIALLPPRHISRSASIGNSSGKTVVTANWRILAIFILIGFMLGIQVLTRSVQPPAQADAVHGLAPSVVQAPTPSQ
jgi:hypothetical protein